MGTPGGDPDRAPVDVDAMLAAVGPLPFRYCSFQRPLDGLYNAETKSWCGGSVKANQPFPLVGSPALQVGYDGGGWRSGFQAARDRRGLWVAPQADGSRERARENQASSRGSGDDARGERSRPGGVGGGSLSGGFQVVGHKACQGHSHKEEPRPPPQAQLGEPANEISLRAENIPLPGGAEYQVAPFSQCVQDPVPGSCGRHWGP